MASICVQNWNWRIEARILEEGLGEHCKLRPLLIQLHSARVLGSWIDGRCWLSVMYSVRQREYDADVFMARFGDPL